MKRLLKLTFIICLLSFAGTSNAIAAEKDIDPQARVIELENRVQQIWKSDVTNLKEVDKVALQQELRSIKKELKEYNRQGLDSRISLSVGGAIIILLLILLIL
ncbi:MAG: hypothetical protein AAF789_06445 [Bacteroidota bacterium]